MGNCQVTEAATVVIQHPGGRVERLYWPAPASDVMKSNPGHYVALVTLCPPVPEERRQQGEPTTESGRFTRVRLLRPKDTLVPGQVYRLVTSQEVIKGLRARKQEKMRAHRLQHQQQQQQQMSKAVADDKQDSGDGVVDPESNSQVVRQERSRQKGAQSGLRQRQWRPSLQSIEEAAG